MGGVGKARGSGTGVWGGGVSGGAGSGELEAGGRSSASFLRTQVGGVVVRPPQLARPHPSSPLSSQRPTPAPVTALARRSPLCGRCGRRGRAPAPRPPR